jgi:hypothetical protein
VARTLRTCCGCKRIRTWKPGNGSLRTAGSGWSLHSLLRSGGFTRCCARCGAVRCVLGGVSVGRDAASSQLRPPRAASARAPSAPQQASHKALNCAALTLGARLQLWQRACSAPAHASVCQCLRTASLPLACLRRVAPLRTRRSPRARITRRAGPPDRAGGLPRREVPTRRARATTWPPRCLHHQAPLFFDSGAAEQRPFLAIGLEAGVPAPPPRARPPLSAGGGQPRRACARGARGAQLARRRRCAAERSSRRVCVGGGSCSSCKHGVCGGGGVGERGCAQGACPPRAPREVRRRTRCQPAAPRSCLRFARPRVPVASHAVA